MTTRHVLGIDIGGSGIKGAMVDLSAGTLATDRLRIDTPKPATPASVAGVVAQIVDHFAAEIGDGPIGITVPAVVTHGVTRTASNIDPSWEDADAERLFAETLGRPVHLCNDADAAGIAEVQFGAAKGVDGLVAVTTLGTGIGSALVFNGVLIPNSELGHFLLHGEKAEAYAAASIREREGLSYPEYAGRLQEYYEMLEKLLWPELIVVGGGISKNADKFLPLLRLNAPIVPAVLRNAAGIVGAAWLAQKRFGGAA